MPRPSKWKRPTKMIRVPIEFEGQLLEIAHKLDNDEVLSFESEREDFESKLKEETKEILRTVPLKHKAYVSKLFNRLKGAIGG